MYETLSLAQLDHRIAILRETFGSLSSKRRQHPHNFGVLAQVLLIGESRFLSPCDFKELGVAKRSRSTTSARSALRQPWSIIARTNF